jgi:hypothetical protein
VNGDAEPLARPAGAPDALALQRRLQAGPAVMHAYYRPSVRSADSIVLDAVSDMLTATRSSRLYQASCYCLVLVCLFVCSLLFPFLFWPFLAPFAGARARPPARWPVDMPAGTLSAFLTE